MSLYQLSQPKLKKPLPQQVGPGLGVMAAGGERTGVVQVPEDVTFYAPLTINTQDYASRAQQTFERASQATKIRNGRVLVVNENASRHESAGLLMEPRSTNLFLNSDAPVTQNITLPVGNHTFSVRGTGSLTSADAGGTATGHGTATQGNSVTINVTGTGAFSFTVSGTVEYAQVEAGEVATSMIITTAAPVTREADQLSWVSTGLVNQTEGMGALLFTPAGTPALQGSNNSRHLLLGPTSLNAWISYGFTTTVGFISDGTTNVTTDLNYVAGQLILLMWRWGSGTMDITNKSGGTQDIWSTGAYDGTFLSNAVIRLGAALRFPMHYRSVYIWNVDKGRSWLESFFAEEAL